MDNTIEDLNDDDDDIVPHQVECDLQTWRLPHTRRKFKTFPFFKTCCSSISELLDEQQALKTVPNGKKDFTDVVES